jgi:hypothetical protein
MLRFVALVRTDLSEELSASFSVTRIGSVRRLLVTASAVFSSIVVTLMKEALSYSETSVLQESHGVTSQKTPFFMLSACFNEPAIL